MLAKTFYALLDIFNSYTHCSSHFFLTLCIMGNKFVKRRIQKTNIHRISVHCTENTLKVFLLIGKEFCQCFLTTFNILRENHFAHSYDLFIVEEHVFCSAKTDTYSSEITGNFSIMRRICISTNLQMRIFSTKIHQGSKIT